MTLNTLFTVNEDALNFPLTLNPESTKIKRNNIKKLDL